MLPAGLPFEVVGPLGQGGIGDVYEVRLPNDPRRLAAKLLRGGNRDVLARFQREGEVVARLRHPHIVAIHSAGALPDGTPFLLFDLVEGESLAERIQRGPLSVSRTAALGVAVGEALVHAHAQGVVHRDVKPGNILLDRAGVPRLTDFGIARALDMEALTQTGQFVGTPAYMAPEQVEGKQVGPPADVYALAAVLYEAICGQPPLQVSSGAELFVRILSQTPDPVSKHCEGVPRALTAVLARCLAKAPSDRPDAAELVATLRDLDQTSNSGAPKLLVFALAVGVLAAALAFAVLGRSSSVEPAQRRVDVAAKPTPEVEVGPKLHDLSIALEISEAMRVTLHTLREAPGERSSALVALGGHVRGVEDGWADVPGRIELLKLNITRAPDTRLWFDSEKNDADNLPSLLPLKQMVGTTATFRVHLARGEYQLSGYAKPTMKILDQLPLIFDAFKRSLSAELVQNGVNVARRVYPGRPVAIGEEWVLPVDVWFNGMRASGQRRCVLERGAGRELKIRVIALEPGLKWETRPTGLTRVTLEGETVVKKHEESRIVLSFYFGAERYRTTWTWTRRP